MISMRKRGASHPNSSSDCAGEVAAPLSDVEMKNTMFNDSKSKHQKHFFMKKANLIESAFHIRQIHFCSSSFKATC